MMEEEIVLPPSPNWYVSVQNHLSDVGNHSFNSSNTMLAGMDPI